MKNILAILFILLTFVSVDAQQYYTAGTGTANYQYTSSYTQYEHGYGNSYTNNTTNNISVPEVSGDPDFVDSVRAAKAYANAFWEEYVLDFTYSDNSGSWHFMQCVMNLKGQVIEVILDDKYIFRREEGIILPGVPLPKGGMKDVYVYVDGVVDDEPKVSGSTFMDYVRDGDRISILLSPLNIIKHIPAHLGDFPAIPDDVDPFDVRLIDQQGNFVGYYYPWLQGFVLWVDPSRSPFYASIYIEGYTGNFGSILIDPLKQQTKKFKGASFDFSLLGGVTRITENNSGNQTYYMDGETVDKNGEVVRAKTFIYDNSELEDVSFWVWAKPEHKGVYLEINVYNVSGGEDELIFKRTVAPMPISDKDGVEFYHNVNLPASAEGWKNIVVVVTTRDGGLQNNEFQFYLYEGYGSGKG